MKTCPLLLPGLLGLLACAACGRHTESPTPTPPPPETVEFKSEEGNFSVQSPVDLSPAPYTMNTALGKIQSHLFAGHGFAGQDDIHQFVVAYVEFPVDLEHLSHDQLAALFEEGPWKNFQGGFQPNLHLIQTAPVARDYYDSGRNDDGSFAHMNRYLLVGNRYYVLQVTAPAGKLDPTTAGEFLRSFKFLRPVN